MTKYRYWIVVVLLLITAAMCFLVPRAQYKRSTTLSELFQIPTEIHGWRGRDVSSALDINLEEARFGFISDALAYEYVNDFGKRLVFIILDAGNFHHPKNCFTSSGYKIKELPDTEFAIQDRDIKAHSLFTMRKDVSSLSLYWIVINKNIAHEWVEQKIKQLYFSMFKKQMVALMVRIDIPSREEDLKETMIMAKQFVSELEQSLQPNHREYVFGK